MTFVTKKIDFFCSYPCKRLSRLPHFLDSRLTDGDKVVSLTHRPHFTPRKIPGTHFYYRLSRPQGHSAAGRIRSIEKSNDLIGTRTRDLACSIVPQPTTLPHAPNFFCCTQKKCTHMRAWSEDLEERCTMFEHIFSGLI
jgi:hypothetical protein